MWIGGVEVVQKLIVSKMVRPRWEVIYDVVDDADKIVVGGVAMVMLVNCLEVKEVGRQGGACRGAFMFPPNSIDIVCILEGCFLAEIKAFCYSVVMEDTDGEFEVRVCDLSLGF